MNRLPIEILTQIFKSLHQQDKIECMRVCQRWQDAITKTSLYHTIRVTSKRQLEDLFRKGASQVLKVERIILDLCLDLDFDMNKLSKLFPYVRVFIAFNVHRSYDNLNSWHKQIEFIAEYSSNIYTRSMLAGGVCNHLETIVVIGEEMQSGKDFIRLLKNAPALKALSLCRFTLSLIDLELLHKNVPLLNSLTLQRIKINDGRFHWNITPAICMTSFIIEKSVNSIHKGKIALSHYIHKKYINLSELVYDMRDMYGLDVEDENKHGFVPLMERLGYQLKLLSVGWEKSDFNTFDMLDNHYNIKKWTLDNTIREPCLNSYHAQIKSVISSHLR